MLTQELDRETEFYLAEILAKENTTSDALIRQLIRDRWLSLHQAAKVASPSQNSSQNSSQNHPNQIGLLHLCLQNHSLLDPEILSK